MMLAPWIDKDNNETATAHDTRHMFAWHSAKQRSEVYTPVPTEDMQQNFGNSNADVEAVSGQNGSKHISSMFLSSKAFG